MTELRSKYNEQFKGFGSEPPIWTTEKFGRCSTEPEDVWNEIGLRGWESPKTLWSEDIYHLFLYLEKIPLFSGLFENIQKLKNGIALIGSAEFNTVGSLDLKTKFIRCILLLAQNMKQIEMPTELKIIFLNSDRLIHIIW